MAVSILGQAQAAGYNSGKHALFTHGNRVFTSNVFHPTLAFTDEQREAIHRLAGKLSKDGPLVQITVTIK